MTSPSLSSSSSSSTLLANSISSSTPTSSSSSHNSPLEDDQPVSRTFMIRYTNDPRLTHRFDMVPNFLNNSQIAQYFDHYLQKTPELPLNPTKNARKSLAESMLLSFLSSPDFKWSETQEYRHRLYVWNILGAIKNAVSPTPQVFKRNAEQMRSLMRNPK